MKEKAVHHSLWRDETKEMVCGAMTTHDEDGHAILWIIETLYKYRHRGYAITLLEQIKKNYNVIETQWLNPIGKKLCLKCGFDYFEDEPNGKNLVWIGDKNV